VDWSVNFVLELNRINEYSNCTMPLTKLLHKFFDVFRPIFHFIRFAVYNGLIILCKSEKENIKL